MPDAVADNAAAAVVIIDGRGTTKMGVRIPPDVMTYFGVSVVTAATPEKKTIVRPAHTRKVFKGLDDRVGENSTVRATSWETPIKAPKGRAGVAVTIPTELKTPRGNLRMVTLRFPAKATVGEISNFIATKFLTNKPKYFLHNGVQYAATAGTNGGTALPPLPKTTPTAPAT